MVDELNKEIWKLSALTEMIMHMEEEPVPQGTTYLLDDICKNLRELVKQLPQDQ